LKKGRVPPISLACGFDFASDFVMTQLPKLSELETRLISLNSLFFKIFQLQSGKQKGFEGHTIAFPHDTSKKIASEISQKMPNIDLARSTVNVVIVATEEERKFFLNEKFDNEKKCFTEKIRKFSTLLSVSAEKIYTWLKALKKFNPLYRNIEIDESNETVITLENLPMEILRNSWIPELSENDLNLQKIQTDDIARSGIVADDESLGLAHILGLLISKKINYFIISESNSNKYSINFVISN
jgi:hypothetical protein